MTFGSPLSASAAGPNVLTNADMKAGTTNWVVNGVLTHSVKTTGRT
jgi:hypothetical protein